MQEDTTPAEGVINNQIEPESTSGNQRKDRNDKVISKGSNHKLTFIDLVSKNETPLITFHPVESMKDYNFKEWYECDELKNEIYEDVKKP